MSLIVIIVVFLFVPLYLTPDQAIDWQDVGHWYIIIAVAICLQWTSYIYLPITMITAEWAVTITYSW